LYGVSYVTPIIKHEGNQVAARDLSSASYRTGVSGLVLNGATNEVTKEAKAKKTSKNNPMGLKSSLLYESLPYHIPYTYVYHCHCLVL
jgi:hypothetical protein